MAAAPMSNEASAVGRLSYEEGKGESCARHCGSRAAPSGLRCSR
jgi:hypothetical protein